MNLDYHVEIDKRSDSVPFRLLREEVEARITAKTVEIFPSRQAGRHPSSQPAPASIDETRRANAK